MYFLKQIQSQFLAQITLYDGMYGPRIQDTASEPVFPAISQKSQPNGVLDNTMLKNLWQHMSAEDLQAFVEEFGKKLEDTKLEEKFVMTQITILINGLRPIAEGKVPGYNIQDEGYQAIKKVILDLEKIHKHLEQEWVELNTMIQEKLKEVMGDVNEELGFSGDKTETEYTQADINTLTQTITSQKTEIRGLFFSSILKMPDDGKKLSEHNENETLKAFVQENADGLKYGYDVDAILAEFDGINIPNNTDLQTAWESLEYAKAQYDEVMRKMQIMARDITIIEGEKTLWEARLDGTQAAYEEILKDEKIKDALSNANGAPEFEDIDMDHIKILKDSWVDLRKIFLTGANGQTFRWGVIQTGQEFTVNFSTNERLAGNMDFSFFDSSAQEIEIDGKKLTFQKDWVHGAGYYDENSLEYPMMDGSNIKILALRTDSNPHQSEAIDTAISEKIADLWELTTKEKMFVESVYNNPNDYFNGKTLPKGIVWAVLAVLSNLFLKTNYVYNPETWLWEDGVRGEAGAMTYGEYKNAYLWEISADLWSLSAEFEAGTKWPYAYNPNDNGHGPSYWTFQMNSWVWVYKEFITRYWIWEWKTAWDAAIQKYGREEFQKMEKEFIGEKNYTPFMNRISIPDKENFSPAMKNVFFSIAVQHWPGGAKDGSLLKIVNAFSGTPWNKEDEAKLINQLYDRRGQIWPAWVASRYNKERAKALAMLDAVTLGSSDIYDQNIDTSKFPNFRSRPAKVVTKSNGQKMTYCSETARLNLSDLGITNFTQWESAKASFDLHPKNRIWGFPPQNTEAKVADLYLDASKWKEQYGHRAVALQIEWKWFVYDPYYAIPGSENNRTWPIPAESYLNHMQNTLGRKIWWAAYYS